MTENNENDNNDINQKIFLEPQNDIDFSNSERNLTNTQDQTIKKASNDNNISIDEDDSINEEVSEDIIKKLKEIVSKAPKLELIIVESLFLEENLKININAKGLENGSLRKKNDGLTYFGLLSPNDENINKKIDFNTGNNEIINTNSDIHYGLQFRIKFDISDYCYYIKDFSFGKGYGTFMKVYKEMKIKDNTLINIGSNYIVLTFGVDEELEGNDTIDLLFYIFN